MAADKNTICNLYYDHTEPEQNEGALYVPKFCYRLLPWQAKQSRCRVEKNKKPRRDRERNMCIARAIGACSRGGEVAAAGLRHQGSPPPHTS